MKAQVDVIKPTLKAPGTKRLKLICDELLAIFAFHSHLRRYNQLAVLRELVVSAAAAAAHRKPGEWLMPSAASGKTVQGMVKEG